MELTIPFDQGRTAFTDSVEGFVAAAESFEEYELLGASRCHGWTQLDVVTHVVAGWHEMLGGMVSVVASTPTVDAGSYWPAFADQNGAHDPVSVLMEQRRHGGLRGALVGPAGVAGRGNGRTAGECGDERPGSVVAESRLQRG